MKKPSKKLVISISLLALVAFGALIANNYRTKTSFKYSAKNAEELKPEEHAQDTVSAAVNADAQALNEIRKNSEILKINKSDIPFGDKNAPVTLVEYASLSCPHCAAFNRESFEKLKTEYIDSGKVLFVFRNFPHNKNALTAAMFALCRSEDNGNSPEKYQATIKALFRTQDSWAFIEKHEDKLESIAKLDGMSSERFKSCISNEALQKKILEARMDAANVLQVKSIPTFFVNSEISEGYVDYAALKKLIDKKIAETSK